MSFIFGGDTGITYEQLQQRRKMVERLRQANSARSPRNVGEGIHAVARALVARGVDKQNAERAEEMRKEYGQLWSGLSPYLSGGAGTPGASYSGEGTFTAAPQPDEDRMGLDMGSTEAGFDAAKNPTETRGGKTYDMGRDVEPDKVALIKETAAELGMDPVDLATIISYETAGTFDPTKAGPTTKWGQHRGLIQFGEPQAKRYGVDWENPLTSQLGRDGAIVRYFRDSGWQPGMSFMDAYSTVNAGAPGRYNASDTAAGGAPGTVADKVNNQMGAHRQKAAALLGGTWTPAASQSGGGVRTAQAGGFDPSIVQLAQMLSVPDEFMPPGQKAVAQALLGQKLTQAQNANDPLRQLQIQKMQMDLQRGMQPSAPDVETINGQSAVWDAQTGTFRPVQGFEQPGYQTLTAEEVAALGLPEGAYQRDAKGKISQIGGSQVSITNNMGQPVEPLGTEGQILVPDASQPGGYRVEVAPGSKLDKERQGEATSKAEVIAKANDSIALIDSVLNDPKLPNVLGKFQGRLDPEGMSGLLMSQDQLDLVPKIQQIQGKAFMDAFESLKGGGQITEREGQAALNAAARLQRYQSPEAYAAALTELRQTMERAKLRAEGFDVPEFGDPSKYGEEKGAKEEDLPPMQGPPLPSEGEQPKRLRYNPATGRLE